MLNNINQTINNNAGQAVILRILIITVFHRILKNKNENSKFYIIYIKNF